MTTLIDELNEVVDRLQAVADGFSAIEQATEALYGAAEEVGKAWSGSNTRYQARVYCTDFEAPSAGERFSQKWQTWLTNPDPHARRGCAGWRSP